MPLQQGALRAQDLQLSVQTPDLAELAQVAESPVVQVGGHGRMLGFGIERAPELGLGEHFVVETGALPGCTDYYAGAGDVDWANVSFQGACSR